MIIKCPDCGHQVSDKAPVCPSCGVEIAGHIVRCSHCGELYLKEEPSCPNCHHTETENPSAGKKGGTDGTKAAGPIVVLPMEEHPADGKETAGAGAQKPAGERKEAARDAVRTPSADADEATVDADFLMEDDADEDVIAAAEAVQEADEAGAEKPAQKHGHVSLAVSLLIAAITAAVLLFLYNQGAGVSRANGEQEAYALALSSDEPTVLQNYLSEHPAAP